MDDERSILFDKQRLKLRKLLHEYDEAVRSLQTQSQQQYGSSAPSQPQYQQNYAQPQTYDYSEAQQSGMMTRQIREDSRLTMAELLSWFTQAGSAEMPELSVPVLESLFSNVTRTNLDGKMSIRDLRQWYISYGKRALRSGVSNFSGEVVPTALVKQPHGRAGDHGKGGVTLRNSKELSRALYEWEKEEAAARPATAAPAGPIALPNHMLEFQVRMTEAEYTVRTQPCPALPCSLSLSLPLSLPSLTDPLFLLFAGIQRETAPVRGGAAVQGAHRAWRSGACTRAEGQAGSRGHGQWGGRGRLHNQWPA